MKKINSYAQNAVHRFWANGQNFLATLIASTDISLENEEITEATTVEELLELTKRKMKEFPLT